MSDGILYWLAAMAWLSAMFWGFYYAFNSGSVAILFCTFIGGMGTATLGILWVVTTR